MRDPTRAGHVILAGVMVYYFLAIAGLTLLVWGALADWRMPFAAACANGLAMIAYGIRTVWRLTTTGVLPRWVAAFCIGVVFGLPMLAMARDLARPLPDPREQAKREAELGWLAPIVFVLGVMTLLAGLLLYLPPVGRYLAYQSALHRPGSVGPLAFDRDGP